jgi:hypothetical protein
MMDELITNPWLLYLVLLGMCALFWGLLALAIYGAMELLARMKL